MERRTELLCISREREPLRGWPRCRASVTMLGVRGDEWGANGETSSEMEKKARNRRSAFGRMEDEPKGEKSIYAQVCVRDLFSGWETQARRGAETRTARLVMYFFFFDFLIHVKDVDMNEWREE